VVILLDTHIWFWWVYNPDLLNRNQQSLLESTRDSLGVSIFSLWEISLLESKGRIKLPMEVDIWFDLALEGSSVQVVDLSRKIIIESNNLPGKFHRDPADRIIVATSRITNSPLLTSDDKILKYPHVLKPII
jgi:PIN domain nuclease of toxin-antitoxin system